MMAEKKEVDGLDIQLELFINHAQSMLRLMRGDVDLLYTGTSTGWENRLNGGPIVLINTGVWGVSYLMGKDRSIREFSDLRGKTVAIPFPGSPLDFQTRFILSKSGLDPDRDVIITYSPFSQTIPKLLMGKLDVAPLPEPLATNVEEGKNLYRLIDYKIAWANASARYVKENPGAGERVAKKYLDFQPSVLEKAIKNTEYYIPPFAENRERVISYYHMIKKFLPGKRGEIDEGFIFFPEGGGN
jgi:NitT/TauT family transport system substrate-binding protein